MNSEGLRLTALAWKGLDQRVSFCVYTASALECKTRPVSPAPNSLSHTDSQTVRLPIFSWLIAADGLIPSAPFCQ